MISTVMSKSPLPHSLLPEDVAEEISTMMVMRIFKCPLSHSLLPEDVAEEISRLGPPGCPHIRPPLKPLLAISVIDLPNHPSGPQLIRRSREKKRPVTARITPDSTCTFKQRPW
jgi:hypothetical protein